MRIAIVHLSDLHFTSDPARNPVSDRTTKITSAVRSIVQEPLGACFIAVTGDVANTGQTSEYERALDFFTSLQDELREALSLDWIGVVVIPGNHDCNFANPSRVREALIHDTIRRSGPNTIDDSIIDQCIGAQDEFFSFCALFDGSEPPSDAGRIYYEDSFTFDGCTTAFHCFNTAWMSEKEETQGQILFPCQMLPEAPTEADLSIALLHHPYNWMEATNSRKFREYVETRCDFILTGHEHTHSRYRKEASSGRKNEYMEGAVLQRSDEPNNSSFAAVLIDLKEKRLQNATWTWDGTLFHRSNEAIWRPFTRTRKTSHLTNTESFSKYLVDLGTGFTHPRKSHVELPDLFIYPDLDNLSANSKGSKDSQNDGIVNSRQLGQGIPPTRVLIMALMGPERQLLQRRFMSITNGRDSRPCYSRVAP